jgi:lysophospholipase L1-like esterase
MTRRLAPLFGALFVLACLPAVVSAAPARYYLAVGDSLAQGQQPNAAGVTQNTNQGYVDAVYAVERRRIHNLKLVKLGCGGETTGSMITGQGNKYAAFFHCHPAGGSQLAAAERFLRAHHRGGEVPLVTLDIGGNDVDGCTAPGVNVATCLSQGEAAINTNLPKIVAGLRKAAPAKTTFAGSTLFDSVLALYFNPSEKGLALASPALAKNVNQDLINGYNSGKFRIADVAGAFDTYDSTTTVTWEGQQIPINVAHVCAWTWGCTTPPSGPNIHPNKNGYDVMAGRYEKVIGRLH